MAEQLKTLKPLKPLNNKPKLSKLKPLSVSNTDVGGPHPYARFEPKRDQSKESKPFIDTVGSNLVEGYNEQMDAAKQGYDPIGIEEAISSGKVEPAFGPEVDSMSQQVITEKNPDKYVFYEGRAYLRDQLEKNDATDSRATRLGRVLVNSEPISPVAGSPRLLKSLKKIEKTDETNAESATEIVEEVGEQVAVGETVARSTDDVDELDSDAIKQQGQENIDKLDDTDSIKNIDVNLQGNTIEAAGEIMRKHGIERDPNKKVSEQLYEFMRDENSKVDGSVLADIRAKYDLTAEDFASMFYKDASEAGSRLQSYSQLDKALKNITKDMSPAERLNTLRSARNANQNKADTSWLRKLNSTRLGLMVSQFATAARNATTAAGNLTVHTMERTIENGFRVAAGKQKVDKDFVTDSFAYWIQMFSRENYKNPHNIAKIGDKPKNWDSLSEAKRKEWWAKQEAKMGTVERVLSYDPDDFDRMFTRYSADATMNLDESQKGWQAIDTAVQWLNTANMFQEYAVRRGVFRAELDSMLKRNTGEGLQVWEQQGKLGDINNKYVKQAIEKSLDVTWANDPSSAFGKRFVEIFQNPVGSMILPFPRFLSQSIKWQFERAPGLGMLKLASPNELRKIRSGDFKQVSDTMAKQATGGAMLYTAWEIRNSEYAGANWNEIKQSDGTTVDMRSYAPFSYYLWVADTMKRWRDGTLNSYHIKDGLEAIGGVQHSQALDVINEFVRMFESDAGNVNVENFQHNFADFLGNYASTYAIPFTQIRDALSAYDTRLTEIRDPALGEWWDSFLEPIQRRMPLGVSEELPRAFTPTDSRPIKKENPLKRMLTGVTERREKNPAEEELVRLGFTRNEIMPSTGDNVVDYWNTYYMGPAVENFIVPLVNSEAYESMSDEEKGEALRLRLQSAREVARTRAFGKAPDRYMRLDINRIPGRRLKMLNHWYGGDLRQAPFGEKE